MQEPPSHNIQDPAMDLQAPPPEAFSDLLARTLADLPDAEEVPAYPDEGRDRPRRSLIQRIIDRRLRRAAERDALPPEAMAEEVAAAPDAQAPEDEDDSLVLEEEAEAAALPAPEPEMVEKEDDVLVLDQEVPASLPPELEIRMAIPSALTEDSASFRGDSPGLLERMFGRRKPADPMVLTPSAMADAPVMAEDEDLLPASEPVPEPESGPDEDDGDILLLDESLLAPGPEPEAEPESGPDVDDGDILLLDESLLAPGPEPEAEPVPEPESGPDEDDGDILLLDESLLASEPEPQREPEPTPSSPGPPTDFLLRQVLDALAAQSSGAPCAPAVAEEGGGQHQLLRDVLTALSNPAPLPSADPVPEPVAVLDEATADDEDDDDILILDDSLEVAPPPPPSPVDMSPAEMTALIAAATPEGMGSLELPGRLDALAALLMTPADDFAAQDLLHECWPRGSINVTSRALLAVAVNLSRNFGLPGKLPMAASKAWRMLDPQIFQAALAQRLAAICDFIFAWQRSQFNFLSLEFGEVELIEYLFESLHPAHNSELLASVMNFKVLSGRRFGLLRRIPVHARRVVDGLGARRQDLAVVHLQQVRALLVRLERPDGFPPIVEAATRALADVDKLIKQVSAPAAPPPDEPPRPGLTLGRM